MRDGSFGTEMRRWFQGRRPQKRSDDAWEALKMRVVELVLNLFALMTPFKHVQQVIFVEVEEILGLMLAVRVDRETRSKYVCLCYQDREFPNCPH